MQRKLMTLIIRCKEKDVIDLATEGTGFADGGATVQATKVTLAFQ